MGEVFFHKQFILRIHIVYENNPFKWWTAAQKWKLIMQCKVSKYYKQVGFSPQAYILNMNIVLYGKTITHRRPINDNNRKCVRWQHQRAKYFTGSKYSHCLRENNGLKSEKEVGYWYCLAYHWLHDVILLRTFLCLAFSVCLSIHLFSMCLLGYDVFTWSLRSI